MPQNAFNARAVVDGATLTVTAHDDGSVSATLRDKYGVLVAKANRAWGKPSGSPNLSLAATLLHEFIGTLTERGVSGFRACGWSCGCRRDEDE
ncbi:hypothetical protein [Nocardioides sp. KR10-350]|uniref:hypothetical protein n=1 Tax=Nocardioides cheoyonin TaxID=3156615 RepID=UPI0032B490FE